MKRSPIALAALLVACAPRVAPPRQSEAKLDNGLRVIVVENREMPVVTLVMRWKNGAATDPADAPGLTLLTHAARVNLSEDVPISFIWGPDFTELRMRLLADELETGLRQLARLSVAPEFDESAFEGAKRDLAGELRRTSDEPDRVARRHVDRLLLGESHPAGRAPDPAAVARISARNLPAHYQRSFGPERAALGIAGDVDTRAVLAAAHRAFAGWKPGVREAAPPAPARRAGVVLVDRPDLTQATIAIARLVAPEDRASLELAAEVVGGPASISSRLMRRARTREGKTYDVRLQVEDEPWGTRVLALSSTRVEEALPTLELLRSELARVATPQGAPTVEELSQARARRLGALVLSTETPEQTLDELLRVWALGLAPSEFEAHRARLTRASPADVANAARLLDPRDAAIVVVGPASALREPLEKRFTKIDVVSP